MASRLDNMILRNFILPRIYIDLHGFVIFGVFSARKTWRLIIRRKAEIEKEKVGGKIMLIPDNVSCY